jgi:pimeloyl-ACP methyl ester carboxylesterase
VLEHAEYGDPSGSPVVFQPGTPGTCGAGAIVAEAASRHGVRMIAVSRPGYGTSATTPPGLASVATQVADLADELGIDRFGVWGLSGGGPYALAQAAVTPDRVTRVVVTGGGAPGSPMESAADLRAEVIEMAAMFSELDVERFLAQPSPGGTFFRDHAHLADAFLSNLRRALAAPDGCVRDNLSWAGDWDFPLSAVAVPVDLVYGEADTMVPPEHGHRLAAAIPHAELHVLPDAGHGYATFGAADLALGLLAGGENM